VVHEVRRGHLVLTNAICLIDGSGGKGSKGDQKGRKGDPKGGKGSKGDQKGGKGSKGYDRSYDAEPKRELNCTICEWMNKPWRVYSGHSDATCAAEGGGMEVVRDVHASTERSFGNHAVLLLMLIVKAAAAKSGMAEVAATIDICDTYSGTGTTLVAAGNISRDMGIRIAVTSVCEIDMTLRDRLRRLWGDQVIKFFGDMDDITEGEVPPHHMMVASPPCQGYSTIGNGQGDNDPRSRSFPKIMQIVMWCRPLIALIEEVMGFLGWNGEGIFLPNGQQGRTFTDLARTCHGAGYRMFHFDIQLAHLGIPQYRRRLWCIPVRGDVHEAMGDFPTPQYVGEQESPQIGPFLLQDSSYYRMVAPIQSMVMDSAQVHYDFKPHLLGTVSPGGCEKIKVWGEKGLSPCVRTSNRIMIALGNEIVEITLEGKAALQGIPLHQLPPDREQAEIAVGRESESSGGAVESRLRTKSTGEWRVGRTIEGIRRHPPQARSTGATDACTEGTDGRHKRGMCRCSDGASGTARYRCEYLLRDGGRTRSTRGTSRSGPTTYPHRHSPRQCTCDLK
jgi:hypothetical protein